VKGTEVEFLPREILFSSAPYFLRLYLPAEIDETSLEQSTEYDTETGLNMHRVASRSGAYTIRAVKKNKGEHFTGLDMVSSMLNPAGRSSARPLVEVVGGDDDDDFEGFRTK